MKSDTCLENTQKESSEEVVNETEEPRVSFESQDTEMDMKRVVTCIE